MRALLGLLLAAVAFGQITQIPGPPPAPSGGAIGGASNCPTAGQVLYTASAGVAGCEAAFSYDATNDRLKIGTGATTTSSLEISTSTDAVLGLKAANTNAYSGFNLYDSAGALSGSLAWGNSTASAYPSAMFFGTRVNSALAFIAGAGLTERARFAATTGNLLLGTTTDDTVNKLQVAGNIRVTGTNYQFFGDDGTVAVRSSNATNGTLQLFAAGQAMFTVSNAGTITALNPTATTGVTQFIVRAGAGQGSTNLTTWQNAAGVEQASMKHAAGNTYLSVSGTTGLAKFQIYADGTSNGLFVASDAGISWKASTDAASGAPEMSLRRVDSATLGIYGSIGGSLRDLSVRDIIVTGTAPATASETCTAGMRRAASGFAYYCVAANTWQRVAIATW